MERSKRTLFKGPLLPPSASSKSWSSSHARLSKGDLTLSNLDSDQRGPPGQPLYEDSWLTYKPSDYF
jgi:hypothetical protein